MGRNVSYLTVTLRTRTSWEITRTPAGVYYVVFEVFAEDGETFSNTSKGVTDFLWYVKFYWGIRKLLVPNDSKIALFTSRSDAASCQK